MFGFNKKAKLITPIGTIIATTGFAFDGFESISVLIKLPDGYERSLGEFRYNHLKKQIEAGLYKKGDLVCKVNKVDL